MAGLDDMDVDFDEQLGLEGDYLGEFYPDDEFLEEPPDEEPDQNPVVLPETQGPDGNESDTTEATALSESPSPLAKRVAGAEASQSCNGLAGQATFGGGGSAPKRRRLHSKTNAEQFTAPTEPKWWAMLDHRAKYVWAYNKIGRVAFKEYKLHLTKACPGVPLPFPAEFGKTKKADKTLVLQWWLEQGSGVQLQKCVAEWLLANFPRPKGQQRGTGDHEQEGKRLRSRQLMFTCQGDWGKVSLPPDVSPSPCLERFLEQLKLMPKVESLWKRVRHEASRWNVMLGANDYTVCLELCTATWEQEKNVRLHAHIAYSARDRMSMTVGQLGDYKFMGTVPHVSEEQGQRRRVCGWASFYYVQAPKISSLWHWGTKYAFLDYPVSGEWVWGLVQSKKMSYEKAKEELVRSAKCLTRHLPNLERLVQESIALDLASRIQAKESILEAERCPFKVLKPVNLLKNDLETPRDRRKFLVLDGPSRLGKTAFCMDLFGKSSTLEVNCMGESHPDLRSFRHTTHRCVLFDEASPEMVLTNRKLFQACNSLVQVAQSKTACYAYNVYLNDALLVISSNHWVEAMGRLPHSEAAWLEANQVLVKVTRPLWIPKSDRAAASS